MAARAPSDVRVLMFGYGTTGQAVCAQCISQGIPIAVSEAGTLSEQQQQQLRAASVRFEQGGHTIRFLDRASTLVLSPGVRPDLAAVDAARERGIEVLSELDWASRQLPNCRTIAVTGTNGKSSTVQAIASIVNQFGTKAWAVGNIGTPLVAIVNDVCASDVVVIEASSYQLEQSKEFRPKVAVLLNLTPDHLARHGTLEAYARAKAGIFERQSVRDTAIMPRALASIFDQGDGLRVYYDEAQIEWPDGAAELYAHERTNLRAALLAIRAVEPDFGVARIPASTLVQAFHMPHRMERLGRIAGVSVINDSKSTNAASTIAALQAIAGPVVLLLGGKAKRGGYELLRDQLAHSDLRGIVAFGEAADAFERWLNPLAPRMASVETLQKAVAAAIAWARPGDTILLSPGCASFDQFDSFAHRGDLFSSIIRAHPEFHPDRSQGRPS